MRPANHVSVHAAIGQKVVPDRGPRSLGVHRLRILYPKPQTPSSALSARTCEFSQLPRPQPPQASQALAGQQALPTAATPEGEQAQQKDPVLPTAASAATAATGSTPWLERSILVKLRWFFIQCRVKSLQCLQGV